MARKMHSMILGAAALAGGASAMPSMTKRQAGCATSEWPGWDGIESLFIFGDSYTQSGFDFTSTQPSAANPMGNPEYPGWTSSNGPNWVDYLTYNYNASSALRTYNLAYGGATVDADLVAPYTDTVLSLKDQVESEFIPGYAPGSNSSNYTGVAWDPATSLFAVWIGINDIGGSWWLGDNATVITPLYDQIFAVYADLLDQLADAGAQNFLLIDVPPIERSPEVAIESSDVESEREYAIEYCRYGVQDWNGRVFAMAADMKAAVATRNVWTYSSYADFDAVLDDPTVFEATAGLKNVTTYCADYENGTAESDTYIEACGIPVNEYFWLNNLHPTSAIHEVVAEEIAVGLEAGPSVC